jgi:hypothetical protein
VLKLQVSHRIARRVGPIVGEYSAFQRILLGAIGPKFANMAAARARRYGVKRADTFELANRWRWWETSGFKECKFRLKQNYIMRRNGK